MLGISVLRLVRTIRTILFLALITALFIGIHPRKAWAENDDLIVPGVRIGSTLLGISEGALYKQLGGPSEVTSSPGYISYVYPKLGLYVYINSITHQVFEIDVAQNAGFHTVEGIKIGLSSANLQTKLPVAQENWPPMPGGIKRTDYKSGMTLVFSAIGTILKISIWSPGGPHF